MTKFHLTCYEVHSTNNVNCNRTKCNQHLPNCSIKNNCMLIAPLSLIKGTGKRKVNNITNEMTGVEIGDCLGYTKSRVAQIMKGAFNKLKESNPELKKKLYD